MKYLLIIICIMFNTLFLIENPPKFLIHSAGENVSSIYKIMTEGFQIKNHNTTNYGRTGTTSFWELRSKENFDLINENKFIKELDKIVDLEIQKRRSGSSIYTRRSGSAIYTLNDGGFIINTKNIDECNMKRGNFFITDDIQDELRIINNNIEPENILYYYAIQGCLDRSINDLNPLNLERISVENIRSTYNDQINFLQSKLNININNEESNNLINNIMKKIEEIDEFSNDNIVAKRVIEIRKINIYLMNILSQYLKKELKVENPKFKDYIQFCINKRKENGLSNVELYIKPNQEIIVNKNFFDFLQSKINSNNNNKLEIILENNNFIRFFPYNNDYEHSSFRADMYLYENFSDILNKLDLFNEPEIIKLNSLNKLIQKCYLKFEEKNIFDIQVETIKALMNKNNITYLKISQSRMPQSNKIIFEKNNGEIKLFIKKKKYNCYDDEEYFKNYIKKEDFFNKFIRVTRRENPEFFDLKEQKKVKNKIFINEEEENNQTKNYYKFMANYINNNYGY